LDLKEAISSLIFASPRCSDLPELLQIRQLFAAKYGKEFAAAAAELRPDCGVNRRVSYHASAFRWLQLLYTCFCTTSALVTYLVPVHTRVGVNPVQIKV
jgi:hypothetical protein